ncbi:recombinase family protein [Paenibacillus sp. LK1]|uniref:recombinase family protein n=1 Tax=Paenibacillus sp. LK1 TaxID=2053014 RepID=UPI000C1950ED|nr:recombinase family protein [Paenibacillus sp. LK1]PIH58246.1 site-specific recombinase [Paenibacillus sp. LK1]
MKVFAYPRVSTDEQADKGNSLIEQKERIAAYCRAMGWDDPIFFIEDGYSAKNLNRPHLTEMLQRIKNEPGPGIVITTKLDRLSRKLVDILNLNEYFNKYGYNYVSATEGFDTSTPAGRLVLQMLGMVAEFERERISERVRDNMTSIVTNSKRVVSRPCFGYNVIDKKMLVNLEESLIVKEMAEWAIEGKGPREIAKRLNARGIKTKEGNAWHDKIVRELLQRETLIGEFVYNKTYRKDSKTITRDPSEWITVKDHHDPIIDKKDFEKIQRIFIGRKTVGRHISNETYLLSGLLICSHCGSKMNGKMNRSFSKKLNRENLHYQYLCDGYLKKATCFHHFVRRDEIEELIMMRIEELASKGTGKLKLVVSKPTNPKDDIAQLKAKLEKIDKKMQKQLDAYNEDLISAHDLKLASEKAKSERAVLTQLLNESSDDKQKKDEAQLQVRAKKSLKDIISGDRLKAKQEIRKLIESITITDGEKLNIIWRG